MSIIHALFTDNKGDEETCQDTNSLPLLQLQTKKNTFNLSNRTVEVNALPGSTDINLNNIKGARESFTSHLKQPSTILLNFQLKHNIYVRILKIVKIKIRMNIILTRRNFENGKVVRKFLSFNTNCGKLNFFIGSKTVIKLPIIKTPRR